MSSMRSTSSTSSIYSRAPEDLIERFAAQEVNTILGGKDIADEVVLANDGYMFMVSWECKVGKVGSYHPSEGG